MRSFNSRVEREVFAGKHERREGYYFLTSEQFDERSPRRWKIRFMTLDCDIREVSDGEFPSKREALARLRQIVEK